MKPCKILLLLISLCLCIAHLSAQLTITWTGANNTTNWFEAVNWNPMVVPDSLDDVIISSVPDSMPLLTGAAQIKSLSLQPGSRLIIDTTAALVIDNNSGSGLQSGGLLINIGQLKINAINRGIAPTGGIGEIRNYGTIDIHAVHQEAIQYHDLFNYYNARIIVQSDSSHGIVLTNELTNRGDIVVKSAKETGLLISGPLLANNCPGVIDISNCKIGLYAQGYFSNKAHIYLNQVDIGIVHEQFGGLGHFQNSDDDVIFMSGIRDTALIADHFINDGYLEIQCEPQSVGIVVQEDQLFINQTGGQINVSGDPESSLIVDLAGDFYTSNFSERDYISDKLNWNYNRNEYHRMVDAVARNFLIHVPEIYDSTTAVPLLFMFHGSSGTGTKFYNISKWVEKADTSNFIVVFPTSNKYYLPEDNNCSTKWSGDGVNRQVLDSTRIIDDIPFVRELISLCRNTFNIDTTRIYACGFSNGGSFVRTRLLDEMASEFSALAGTGGFGFRYVQPVPDSIYVPFHDLVGSIDDRALESSNVFPEFPYTADSLFALPIVRQKIINATINVQVDTVYTEESFLPADNLIKFQEDLSGQGNEYRFIMVPGLGHSFANGINHPLIYVDILWPWFMQWTR